MNPAASVGALSIAQPSRMRMLDLLRFVAAVQMVQGHTIDAVLSPAFRAGTLHQTWLWLRGLTSVAFLVAAGLSFSIGTLRDMPRHRSNPAAVAKRFRRAGLLVLLGYMLHSPLALAAAHDARLASAVLSQALAVDVLQCIGVSLALLELLVLVLPNARAVELACAAVAALMLGLSPAARALPVSGVWSPLLNYVSPRAGSLFPLLPWSAHVFAGVALGRLLLVDQRRPLRLALTATLLIACAKVLALVPGPVNALVHVPALTPTLTLPPVPDHLMRLGCVLAGAAFLSLFESAVRALPAWVWVVSGETLFVYAFHVLLVYGQGLGLADRVGPTLAPGPALLAALGMIALSFACALGYRRISAGLAGSTATG